MAGKQYTVSELAQTLRARPGGEDYADLPDDVFVQRWIERNPQYSDILKPETSGRVATQANNPAPPSPPRSGEADTPTASPLGYFQRLFQRRLPGDVTSYQAMDPAEAERREQQATQEITDSVGRLVPDAAVPALAAADKYAVQPFTRMAQKGGELAKQAVRENLVSAIDPEAVSAQREGGTTLANYSDRLAGDPRQVEAAAQRAETAHPYVSGVAEGLAENAGGMAADPRQWPLLFAGGGAVRPLLAKAMTAGFGAQMTGDTVQGVVDLSKNWDKLTPEQRAEKITSTGLTGLFATLSAAHVAGETEAGPEARAETSDAQAAAGTAAEQSPGAQRAQNTVAPETEEGTPPIGPGPGAQTASSLNEVGLTPMQQLTEWLPNVTSPKQSPLERMKSVQGAIQAKVGYVQDNLARHLTNAEGSVLGLWDAYRRPPDWTGFDDAIGKWTGAKQYNAVQLQNFAGELKNAMPDAIRREAITNYLQAGGDENVLRQRAAASKPQFRRGYETALKLSQEEKILANNVRNYLDAQLEEAKRAGLLEQGVQDYVSQIWQKSPEQAARLQALNAASQLSTQPFFTRERLFKDYFEGEQKGFQPKSKDVGFLLGSYEQAFGKALADRGLIKQLLNAKASDGRPLVQVSGVGRTLSESELSPETKSHLILPHAKGENAADYIAIDSPAMRRYKWVAKDDAGKSIFLEGDVLAHPEIAKKLKNVLTPSAIQNSKVGRAALKLSGEFKSTLLSLSMFHQVQLGVHGVEHLVNPLRLPKLDLENSTQRALIDHGLMVASFDAHEAFSEGLSTGTGLLTKVPGIGPKLQAYQRYLFQDYLPRLKMSMALHALDRNVKRYGDKLSRDQILRLTSEQANAAFGHLNYAQLGRNKTFQDVLRMTLLAPDFLEARGRFVAQAAKPYGREQARALATGAFAMYVGARILNQLLNGNSYVDDPKMIFSVRVKGRTYALRTVQGDILHLISNPREFVEHRLNPITTRPLLEALTGRDTFGRQRNAKEQVQDFAKNIVPIPLQSLVRPADFDIKESLAKSLGLTADRYRTPAARKAHEFVTKGATFSESSRSPEEQQLMRQYRSQIDAGKFSADQVRNEYKRGRLTEREAKELMKESKSSQLSRDFNRLSLEKALAVWSEANDTERRELRPLLAAKARRQLPNRVPAERGALQQKVQKALSERSTPAPVLPRMLRAARLSQ